MPANTKGNTGTDIKQYGTNLPELYAEMVANHLHENQPSVPSSHVPIPLKISKQKIVKILKSCPSAIALDPSRLWANHIKEAMLSPSPDLANARG